MKQRTDYTEITMLLKQIIAHNAMIAEKSELIREFQKDKSKNHLFKEKETSLKLIGTEAWCDGANITIDDVFIDDVISNITNFEHSEEFTKFLNILKEFLKEKNVLEWECYDRHRTENYDYFVETYTEQLLDGLFSDYSDELSELTYFELLSSSTLTANPKEGITDYVTVYDKGAYEILRVSEEMFDLINNAFSKAITLYFIYENTKCVTYDW